MIWCTVYEARCIDYTIDNIFTEFTEKNYCRIDKIMVVVYFMANITS